MFIANYPNACLNRLIFSNTKSAPRSSFELDFYVSSKILPKELIDQAAIPLLIEEQKAIKTGIWFFGNPESHLNDPPKSGWASPVIFTAFDMNEFAAFCSQLQCIAVTRTRVSAFLFVKSNQFCDHFASLSYPVPSRLSSGKYFWLFGKASCDRETRLLLPAGSCVG